MLLEMAVADSYGIGFEFCDHTPDRPNDLKAYYQHPKYADMKPGHYTDDTQRAIANAKVVLSGNFFDADRYIDSYVMTFRDDPRPGYSRNFQKFIEECIAQRNDAVASVFFRQNVKRTAASNGAIMGAAVLGYISNPADCALAAAVQALTTHSQETIPYAQAVALSANWFLYDKEDEHGFEGRSLDDYLDEYVTGDLPSCAGEDRRTTMDAKTTWRAIRRTLELPSLSAMLRESVSLGGDTDSVAASTVAIASADKNTTNDIPNDLILRLEAGPYGRCYLLDLDQQLTNFRDREIRWMKETA